MSELPVSGNRRAKTHPQDESKRPAGAADRSRRRMREAVEPARRKRPRIRESAARRKRRLRLALVSLGPELARALDSLALAEEIELIHLNAGESSRRARGIPGHFDAILVEEGPKHLESGWIRWLRKTSPEVPLISIGSRRDRARQTAFALHLRELPGRGGLRSAIQDARRHLQASRKAANLSRKLRETSRQLQVLGGIVSTANSILEPRRVVNVIMSQIQQLIPSEAWSILLVDEETGELAFEVALGENSSDLNDIRIKLGEGVAGWVAQTGEPAVVNDVRRDRRFQGKFDQLTRFQTRSILCAPLISRGRTIGVVEIMNRASGTRFTKKDMNLLLTLVEPAAIALENAILFQKTEQLAVTDDLTKLYNSRYLNGYLDKAIARAKKSSGSLAVLFLDLDGFKSINDRHGHFYGSRSLREVGDLIRTAVREEDVVSRYGGDEFVVVLPDTDAVGALAVAERIRTSLKNHVFLAEFGLAAGLSASFGVSLYPEHGQNPQDLMQKADQAMYSVKERGKDAVCLAT